MDFIEVIKLVIIILILGILSGYIVYNSFYNKLNGFCGCGDHRCVQCRPIIYQHYKLPIQSSKMFRNCVCKNCKCHGCIKNGICLGCNKKCIGLCKKNLKKQYDGFLNRGKGPSVWEVGSLLPFEKVMAHRWYPGEALAHNTHTYSEDYLAHVASY